MNTKKAPPTTVRLTEHAANLLTTLAEKHGVSKAAIIEMAIREKAEKDKVNESCDPKRRVSSPIFPSRRSSEYKQALKLPRTANGKANPERVA